MSKVSKLDELSRSWAIAVKDMRIYYLKPSTLMFGVLFPFTLFLSFTVGRDIPIDRLVPMLVAQTVFWASSSVGPTSIPLERRLRTFERYLSAPLSLISLLFGKTLAGMIFGLSVSVLSLLIGIIALGATVTGFATLLISLALSSLVFSAMGIMFASIPTENPGDVMMPLTSVRIPLLFISGIFIPISQLPPVGQVAAFMSPLTHTLDLIRAGLGGQSNFGIAVNILILLLYIAAFMWLGTRFNLKIMKSE